ncbi:MAG: hypothetical protein K6B40_07775 [Firmicutes bacterium]|nr:hypothetical protein [Bacillota bacterium]
MRKALILITLCLLVCFALCGCGKNDADGVYADGVYTIEVSLAGGTGRASVESPAQLTINGEEKIATIVWSSPYYEYMQIGDTRYEPVQKEGNSTFEIPVELDTDMEVSACTIAMSQPHVIEYKLHFDSATIKGE